LPLIEARQVAAEARKQLALGQDPMEVRRHAAAATAKSMTFEQCAEACIEDRRAGWRNAKHADQWASTLETYAYPVIGNLSVASIDTALVLKIIRPLWATKTETASRLRGRLESVLAWATVHELRSGPNPAQWRNHLGLILQPKSKVAAVVHHAALPYAEVGAFMAELRRQEGIGARALEFAILTATRTSETLNATWGEIDEAANLWTIPASRMKGNRVHRVPLSDAALTILASMKALRHAGDGGYIFQGGKVGKPLSSMALLMTLRRMDRSDLTAHGFRSTFRDWASEHANFHDHVAEQALAHAIGSAAEAAYRRGDLLEKRKRLMAAWADYCATTAATSASVVPLRRA
jgi:integrase